MGLPHILDFLAKASYFLAAVLFILGLMQMASPVTARRGIKWAGVGMVLATLVSFVAPATWGAHGIDGINLGLMIVAIALSYVFWVWGKKVPLTDMPQMVAIFNGMGGGSAAAIGAAALLQGASYTGAVCTPEDMAAHACLSPAKLILAVLGSLIGAVSFSGSVIAWAKLDGRMDKRMNFAGQQAINLIVFVVALALGAYLVYALDVNVIIAFFIVSLVFGVLMTLPIGGADMPVVISLYNAFTGLAVAFKGYVLGNEALIIAGTVVGAAGMLLTQLMAKAMNRPITGVLFSQFGGGGAAQEITGSQKPIDAGDVAALAAYAERVVIVPGYGLAVAQAQHKLWEFCKQLIERGVKVSFAIHPVAGRMPGHMNVLLAEAGVPYDLIVDMDDINPEFKNTDLSIVIGANDVVNPVAKTDPASPIYGMPILDVSLSKNVVIIKRGKGTGFAGIENALFYQENARMLFMDGQAAAAALIAGLKELDGGGH
jgi:NAD(P) transhydrogenase subunit beta